MTTSKLVIPDAFILTVLAQIYDTSDVNPRTINGSKEQAAINWLSACDLIGYHELTEKDHWECTPKGKFYVEYMMSLPMPVMRWVMHEQPEATTEPTNG